MGVVGGVKGGEEKSVCARDKKGGRQGRGHCSWALEEESEKVNEFENMEVGSVQHLPTENREVGSVQRGR